MVSGPGRIAEVNLNDGSVFSLSNIQCGRQTDFTLGLNWYPDIGIRLMANWVDVTIIVIGSM